uniref:SEC-C metal-binding domain-containing protein n=1 Tax=Paramylibacter ulvae TaxID=1651968 RepID=UPI00167B319C|nr:SEC-C metal-binding domain-containing protein [Amylibacter ulvae]
MNEIKKLSLPKIQAMKGRDRNAPCWCGSGKKFKKCHFGRDAQPKGNPWDAVDVNRKSYSQKKCCARDVGLGECDGRVIKAHTVSRGPNLAKIAKDGHVLHYVASIPDMNKNGGKLSVKKIGIKDASVFHGFCSKHDRELFSCIENEVFVGRPDQCLAVASTFRDWASEVANAPREVAEMSLAHKVGSDVERAYARSDLLERRRLLMESWSGFVAREVEKL